MIVALNEDIICDIIKLQKEITQTSWSVGKTRTIVTNSKDYRFAIDVIPQLYMIKPSDDCSFER